MIGVIFPCTGDSQCYSKSMEETQMKPQETFICAYTLPNDRYFEVWHIGDAYVLSLFIRESKQDHTYTDLAALKSTVNAMIWGS